MQQSFSKNVLFKEPCQSLCQKLNLCTSKNSRIPTYPKSIGSVPLNVHHLIDRYALLQSWHQHAVQCRSLPYLHTVYAMYRYPISILHRTRYLHYCPPKNWFHQNIHRRPISCNNVLKKDKTAQISECTMRPLMIKCNLLKWLFHSTGSSFSAVLTSAVLCMFKICPISILHRTGTLPLQN